MPWDPAIARPDCLYSPPPHGKRGDHGRPHQTITPLSEKLNVPIDVRFGCDEERELAEDVLACAGVVVIAWEHKRIPRIANAILGDKATAPQTWPGERFDVTWIFDLQPDGGYRFSQRPQQLLGGDRADVISTTG